MVKVFHYIYDKEYSRKSSHKPHHVRVSNVTIVNNNLKNLNKILCDLKKPRIFAKIQDNRQMKEHSKKYPQIFISIRIMYIITMT